MKIRKILLGVCAASLTSLCQAQVTEMLYSTPPNPARDNYTGGIGCRFQVGASSVVVSHLGVFDINDDGLNVPHDAGVFSSNGSTQLARVAVPAANRCLPDQRIPLGAAGPAAAFAWQHQLYCRRQRCLQCR